MTDTIEPPEGVDADNGARPPRAFQRKPWSELSESYRRRLEAKGYTRAHHERGEPIPRDRAPRRGGDEPTTGDDTSTSGSSSPPTDDRPEVPRKRGGGLRDDVEQMLGMAGLAVFALDQFDGTVIMAQASDLADALMELADRFPRMRRTLELITRGGDALAIGGALTSVALPMLMHHGLVPANPMLMATVPPEAVRYFGQRKPRRAKPQPEDSGPQNASSSVEPTAGDPDDSPAPEPDGDPSIAPDGSDVVRLGDLALAPEFRASGGFG